MYTKEINGKSIRTNLNENYSFTDGNDKKTMKMCFKRDIHETDEEMFQRLVKYGYTTITFYNSSTRISGYYDTIAYCKSPKGKDYTFILVLKDGTKYPFYCQKNELKNYMTVEEIEQQDYIYILNNAFDNVKHKPFKIQ